MLPALIFVKICQPKFILTRVNTCNGYPPIHYVLGDTPNKTHHMWTEANLDQERIMFVNKN